MIEETLQTESAEDVFQRVSLDVGFNLNALAKFGNRVFVPGEDPTACPPSEDLPALMYGFTVPDKVGNPIQLARNIKKKFGEGAAPTRMQINLFDLTRRRDRESYEVDRLSFKISFESAAKDQEALCPVEPLRPSQIRKLFKRQGKPVIEFVKFAIYRDRSVPPNMACSTVFEQCVEPSKSWHIWPPEAEDETFPNSQLVQNATEWGTDLFEVAHIGNFYFTMELKVWTSAQKEPFHFRVDPEMVVETAGPDGGPDGDSSECWEKFQAERLQACTSDSS